MCKIAIANSNSGSVHIRRGDYVNNFHHDICDEEYYKKAIKYIQNTVENPVFYIFSTDMNYCKILFENVGNVHYVNWNTKNQSFRDMQLMSLCKHNIIANSSFSWWGAWLNENQHKIVIAPKNWFRYTEGSFQRHHPALRDWTKL